MRLFFFEKLMCTILHLLILGIIYILVFAERSNIIQFTRPLSNTFAITPSNTNLLKESRIYEFQLLQNHLHPHNPKKPTDYTLPKEWKLKSFKKWKATMAKFIIQRLKGKRKGFFIECGAYDGFFISNTLLLEQEYNWTGLLVEADPGILPQLKARNRKAWVADVCLSPKPEPMNITMRGANKVMGHGYIPNDVIATDRKKAYKYMRRFRVECYPLDMLLDAVGVKEVDYFSLDVEGVELDILKTIPWDEYFIKLISVEVRSENKAQIQRYMKSVGYQKIKEIVVKTDMIHDHVYERNDVREI